MSFSGAEVTRLGLNGGPMRPYGSFAGKAVALPVFAGVIADISEVKAVGIEVYDLASYFTGATSYSISPTAEDGWTFDTSLCVLTINTGIAGEFGPYIITGTNASGGDDSNSFSISITSVWVSTTNTGNSWTGTTDTPATWTPTTDTPVTWN